MKKSDIISLTFLEKEFIEIDFGVFYDYLRGMLSTLPKKHVQQILADTPINDTQKFIMIWCKLITRKPEEEILNEDIIQLFSYVKKYYYLNDERKADYEVMIELLIDVLPSEHI